MTIISCSTHFLSFLNNVFSTVTDWDSMDRVTMQTGGRAFQTLGRAFSLLVNSQKRLKSSADVSKARPHVLK